MTAHDDDLRAAFASRPDGPPTPACPSPDELLLAYAGEVESERRRAVIEHLATCAACAADWRLAREVLPDEAGLGTAGEVGEPGRLVRGPWAARLAPLALAATLLVAVAGAWLLRGPEQAPEYRGTEQSVRTLVADDAVLPRDAFRLRWALDAAGARFAVTVSSADLEPLAEARDLERSEYVVPERSLRGLAEGTRLLWQIHARLPDGSSVRSATFRVRVGTAAGATTRAD